MSRRNVLSAAGIGVAAAAAGGAATYLVSRPDAGRTTKDTAATSAAGPASAVTGPVVVYLENLKTGELEILAGTTKTAIRDKALADQIARAAG